MERAIEAEAWNQTRKRKKRAKFHKKRIKKEQKTKKKGLKKAKKIKKSL